MEHSIDIMPDYARLWVYQSNRFFNDDEVRSIKTSGEKFIQNWAAHGASLKASFDVLHNLFIVIAVDEKQAMASGCSIDSSVKFIKELENIYSINLFDRMQVAYKLNNELKTCKLSEFEKLAEKNEVNENTIVYNNMVTTKKEFDEKWESTVLNSWHYKYISNYSNKH